MTTNEEVLRRMMERSIVQPGPLETPCRVSTYSRKGPDKRYAQIVVDGSNIAVHIMMWLIKNGPIAKGMCVCHKCDNGACFAEDHLFLGTQAENMRDMVQKGRSLREASHYNTKLSDEQVIAIRNDPRPQPQIAAEYGITQQHVSSIKRFVDRPHVKG